MAKKSQINRNKKREKLVAQYAARRAALKAKADDMSVAPEDRFAARLKLAELPRNSSKTRIHHRCEFSGRQGLLPQGQALAYRASGPRQFRPDPGHDQGQLVGERRDMAITDPIGDLLARIRNGQLRGTAKIKSPNSRLRIRLLDVLQQEGYIRGYAEVEFKETGRKELEIELKYHEGRPAIRELKRVSTPGRRVYTSVKDLKPHRQGLGVSIVSTPQGVMTDSNAREKNVGGEVLCQVF